MENRAIDEETPLLLNDEFKLTEFTPPPKLQMAILFILRLCEPLASSAIFSFINELILELDITGGDKRKVGYYAGLIESLFFATETMTGVLWGKISDHLGRKPILLIGSIGNVVSVLCFGLSRTFSQLAISRCLCGFLNGNSGVVNSAMGDLTDHTNSPAGITHNLIALSIGATISPVIGGSLARPHERFPTIFKGEFWKDYPYFLPCLVVAISMSISSFMTLFFKETSPNGRKKLPPTPPPPSCINIPANEMQPLALLQLLTYPVIVSISNHATVAFLEASFAVLLPLFMSTPVEFGGLGCSSTIIGYVLAGLGASLGIFQSLFFALLVRRYGERRMFIAGHLCMIAINCFLLPLISAIVRHYGVTWVAWSLLGLALVLRIGLSMSLGCILIYATAASPNKESLSTMNRVSQMSVSAAKAFSPGLTTSLFALSLEKNLYGGYGLYAALFVFSSISLVLALYLPNKVWDHEEC